MSPLTVAGEALDRRPAAHVDHVHHVGVAGVGDDQAVARHHAQQLMELPLDRRDVGIDVGVVVLEIVEHRGARPVVHELGALVEERRVVLVRLDDEVPAAAEPRRDVEIAGHAADQKSRIEAGVLEDPGENARRRGLAVRAGDRQRPALGEHVPRQPFRAGRVGNAAFQQRLDQRIAAAHDVADDDDVRLQLQLLRVVAFDQLDAERASWSDIGG